MSVTDAPVDSARNVFVEFTGVELQPQKGPRRSFDFAEPKRIDLLALQGGDRAPLLDDVSVPAGRYNWIRLKVNAELDGVWDTTIVLEDGSELQLGVPSGSRSGLKLVRGFTVAAGSASDFTIDFDLRKSIVDQRGPIGWHLKPVLRLVDNMEVGAISGTVAPRLINSLGCSGDAATGAGNVIYVYQSADAALDDMGGTGSKPLTSASVSLNSRTGAYQYTVAFLPAGNYALAFTCRAADDDPEADDSIVFVSVIGADDVAVTAGEMTTFDFTAP